MEKILSLFLVFSPMVFLIHYLQNANCKSIFIFKKRWDFAASYIKKNNKEEL